MQNRSDAVSKTSTYTLSGATVTVTRLDGSTPTIYSDDGVTVASNPLTTDSSGEYSYYAPNGWYVETIAKTGFTTETKTVLLFDPKELSGASAEYEGAVGDGATTDWTAWTNALAKLSTAGGGIIHMQPGKRYALHKRLVIPAKCTIIGHPTSSFVALASGFTNTNLAVKYDDTSCVLDASGLTTAPYTAKDAPQLIGVVIETSGTFSGSGATMGRVVDAIVARNVTNLVIDGCKVSGFGVGRGIRVSSVTGNSRIVNNYITSFSDDSNWATSGAQITGIEVDDDRVNNVASVGIDISGNTITSLTCGATFIASAAAGYQSDGINIKAQASIGHRISRNYISTVGEGIDCFGSWCTITGNEITDTYIAGLKLVNGATYCDLTGNGIRRGGRWGILIQGSNTSTQDIQGHNVSGNTISEIDQSGAWAASGDTACIATSGAGLTYKPKDCTISGNHLNPGANGKYAIWRGSDGTNINWINNDIQAAGTSGRVGNGGSGETGRYVPAVPGDVVAYSGSNQSVANDGAWHDIVLDTKDNDSLSEHNTGTYAATIKEPGRHVVSARARFGTVVAGEKFEIQITKNGSTVAYHEEIAAGAEVTLQLPLLPMTLAVGDVIKAQLKNGGAAGRTYTGGAPRFTSLTVLAV